MTGTITWRELWGETAQTIDEWHGAQRLGVVESRRIARFLCEAASGAEGTEFLEILEDPATERTVHALDAMVARVRAGEPLQYVLGRWGFRHLDLIVDRRVLVRGRRPSRSSTSRSASPGSCAARIRRCGSLTSARAAVRSGCLSRTSSPSAPPRSG
jgi:hypothetical protein